MSSCANEKTCPGGNCVGCYNSKTWCQDPRCEPYCPGEQCLFDEEHDMTANLIMILILVSLVAILFIVWFFYGPTFFQKGL